MKLIISEIPIEGLNLDTSIVCESESIISPVNIHLRIDKADTEISIKGDFSARLRLQCSRCLNEFEKEDYIHVDVVYHPLTEIVTVEKHEIKIDELNTDFYSGDELDISALIKEQIELNIPMKPLCDELCKGICPGCGADLNFQVCSCPKQKIDPRFAELSKLLK
ncbi:MAG: DUF177 domain-containing protein [Nitrospirae bacterium]|jgi:uncharacterized protein|nr:DUF177 domain-containing protein [Nitrospirota bacterium]